MLGNPTPLTKIGQSLLCTGSSTQDTQPVPTFDMATPGPRASKNGHLGPCINTHKYISLPTISHGSRVNKSLLIHTYIKIYNFNTCYTPKHISKFKVLIHVLQRKCQSHNPAFFSNATSSERRPPVHSLYLK